MTSYLLLVLLLLIVFSPFLNADNNEPPSNTNTTTTTTTPSSSSSSSSTTTTNEAQIRQRARAIALRRKWKATFEEIKNLVVDFNIPPTSSSSNTAITTATATATTTTSSGSKSSSSSSSESGSTSESRKRRGLDEWKLLLNTTALGKEKYVPTTTTTTTTTESTRTPSSSSSSSTTTTTTTTDRSRRQRFDGFAATWESRLEQWADDVADYLRASGATGGEEQEGENGTVGDTGEGEEGGGGYSFSRYGQSSLPNSSSSSSSSSNHNDIRTLPPDENTTATITSTTSTTTTVKRTFAPRTILPNDTTLPHTDLSDLTKKIWIVTTAAYPWMTGTAVNPLLRAAHLATIRSQYVPPPEQIGGEGTEGGIVTLMIPWLERTVDRNDIYGKGVVGSMEEQEQMVRDWLRKKAGMVVASEVLRIRWYPARLETQENSIYSMGDIISLIPEEEVDICVLEEPEHLNWYRAPGEAWTKKFKHVVGIVHTNYFVYAQEQPGALIRAPAMRLLSSWMCRAHCHRIIKLSGTLGQFAPEKEIVENVHGVRQTFLDYGVSLADTLRLQRQPSPPPPDPVFGPDAPPTVYFIGKMLWSKGIGSLMELLRYAEESAGLKVKVDMYGGGPNMEEARVKAEGMGLDMPFLGPIDHAALAPSHKIFINPSLSEVLCTTVAEALAMGKFVVVPSHPSNDFFAQFPNCLTYANKEEFVGNLYYALTHSPEPLSEEYSHALSWEAACKRFEAAGSISLKESKALQDAIAAEEAGIEIDLPPIIENPTRLSQISTTVKKNRDRYRSFRTALSLEIRRSNVLPKEIRSSLLKELDRRLDIDVDTLLGSPKLKLQLSPAELDKRLLDLYDDAASGPRGDVLRWIGAGGSGTVSAQYLYIRNQEMRTRWRQERGKWERQSVPQFLEDVGAGNGPTTTKWIKRVLKRNLQQSGVTSAAEKVTATETEVESESEDNGDEAQGILDHDDTSHGENTRRPATGDGRRISSELRFRPSEVVCGRPGESTTISLSKSCFRPRPIRLDRSHVPRRLPFTATPLI